jgi:group II intron reverse transcriptase/maturase
MSPQLRRIAELARDAPGMSFTSLNHVLTVDLLREAYRQTRKDGATGVDGQTASEYAERLEENLRSLHERAKTGLYRAPPVRRVHIPKGKGGETRPLGIPTFEDKILQRSVAIILNAVYEPIFHDFSYGFRPGRSAHHLLDALRERATRTGGGWLLEADIRKFFDSVDHGQLREVLHKRVRDGVILRLIGKWLNAGVLEEGAIHRPTEGTPQGGVISPLLANIFLHEVLDTWWTEEVRPRLRRGGHLYRYADDFVILFEDGGDARRVLDVLAKRFARYGLALHPEKTRLVRFLRPDRDDDGPGPETFDLLGFTHHWGRSRKGRWVVRRITSRRSMQRGLHAISQWLRWVRHAPLPHQRRGLVRRLQGHYGYFGVTGNHPRLGRYRWEAIRLWRHWLSRRSQRAGLSWEKFQRLLHAHPIPPARVVRSIYA